MLTPDQQAEILIRLDERVKKIRDDQKDMKTKMESTEGYPRCQMHQQDLDEIKGIIKWVRRTTIGAVITTIIGAVTLALWDNLPFLR